jgi:hypothetical protein
MKRWEPARELSARGERMLRSVSKSRKLLDFLCRWRREIFNDSFQGEMEKAYRQTGQGEEPHPPAMMCMAMLLQAYLQVSDAEVVSLTGTDRRWRLLLDLPLDEDDPAFSQGAYQQFRVRFIRHDLDERLLKRTAEVAKSSGAFDSKKLPKQIRTAADSRPLEGAGRVEDTVNLLGHAGCKLAEGAARLLGVTVEEICAQARVPLLVGTSIKAALDLDWSDPSAKGEGLNRLVEQLDRLSAWVGRHLGDAVVEAPLKRYIETLVQIQAQDLERQPDGSVRLHQGVAADRQISIEDPEMRHGRKSKSKKFNGYKEYIEADLDTELILATAVLPANRPEEEAAPLLQGDLERMGFPPAAVEEFHIDRAFLNSEQAANVEASGGEVVCKPWSGRNRQPDLFGKRDFEIDVRKGTITCPAGQVEAFEPGQVVEFDPEACGACPLRPACSSAASGRGRTVTIGDDEDLQQRLRRMQSTPAGRARFRERTAIEHRLAHLSQRKGKRARYRGIRNNHFDLRRHSALLNFEVIANRLNGR